MCSCESCEMKMRWCGRSWCLVFTSSTSSVTVTGYELRVHTCNCKTVNVYVYVYLGTVQLYSLLPVHTKIPGTVFPSSFCPVGHVNVAASMPPHPYLTFIVARVQFRIIVVKKNGSHTVQCFGAFQLIQQRMIALLRFRYVVVMRSSGSGHCCVGQRS